MPWRPSNIAGGNDAVQTVNQLLRETNFRIDNLSKTTSALGNRIFHNTLLTFGPVAGGSAVEVTVSVLGANTTGAVTASPSKTLGSTSLIWSAYVPTTNVVAIRVANPTGGSLTPNAVTWNIAIHL